MQRFVQFLVPSLLVLAVGCTADAGDESFIIRDNLAVLEGGTCTIVPSLSATRVSRGQLALDSPIPYLLTPMFESRIVAPEGRESLRTIFIQGGNVELDIGPIELIDAEGNVTIDAAVDEFNFKTLFSADLAPNGGLATAAVDLVPAGATALIRQRTAGAAPGTRIHAQVTARLTAFGDYYGEEIESTPFQYSVTVCNDCVTRTLLNEMGTGPLVCPAPAGTTVSEGNPCNPFQDGIVDCCQAAMGDPTLICPAPLASN